LGRLRTTLGKDKIDLAIDPPPDLAIEVNLASITDVEAYIPLQIPELWIYSLGQLIITGWEGRRL
jgi:Uma2 family endonuclease